MMRRVESTGRRRLLGLLGALPLLALASQSYASGIGKDAAAPQPATLSTPRAASLPGGGAVDPLAAGSVGEPAGASSPELRIVRQELVLSRAPMEAGEGDSVESWVKLLDLDTAKRQGATWSVVSRSESEIRLIVECSFDTCAGLDAFNRRLLRLTNPGAAGAASKPTDSSEVWLDPSASERSNEQEFLEAIVPTGGELPEVEADEIE